MNWNLQPDCDLFVNSCNKIGEEELFKLKILTFGLKLPDSSSFTGVDQVIKNLPFGDNWKSKISLTSIVEINSPVFEEVK